ncbi:1389_t:CDS:2, partial [Ambispora gerdemannii]
KIEFGKTLLESEIVDEEVQLQWKKGMVEFEGIGLRHLKETSSAVQEKQISSYKQNASKVDEETVSATSIKKNNRSEITDDSEIIDEVPLTDWELDTPIPSWIQKAME